MLQKSHPHRNVHSPITTAVRHFPFSPLDLQPTSSSRIMSNRSRSPSTSASAASLTGRATRLSTGVALRRDYSESLPRGVTGTSAEFSGSVSGSGLAQAQASHPSAASSGTGQAHPSLASSFAASLLGARNPITSDHPVALPLAVSGPAVLANSESDSDSDSGHHFQPARASSRPRVASGSRSAASGAWGTASALPPPAATQPAQRHLAFPFPSATSSGVSVALSGLDIAPPVGGVGFSQAASLSALPHVAALHGAGDDRSPLPEEHAVRVAYENSISLGGVRLVSAPQTTAQAPHVSATQGRARASLAPEGDSHLPFTVPPLLAALPGPPDTEPAPGVVVLAKGASHPTPRKRRLRRGPARPERAATCRTRHVPGKPRGGVGKQDHPESAA